MTEATPTSLIGTWAMSRQVTDLASGTTGAVRGRLDLRHDGDEISWDEQGRLAWNGHDVPVSRSYRFVRGASGWWLHFSDRRPFHPWLPGAVVTHQCREDTYRGLITIATEDRWQVRWEVGGPAKSQLITTRLVRGGESARC